MTIRRDDAEPQRPASDAATPDAAKRVPEILIRTAERLLATHGIDGVSMRQIAAEAGYRNPATVQYHFGSKEALVRAVIEHRLPSINRRRLELLERLGEANREHDVRGLVEAMARPLLELGPDSYYVELLTRLTSRPELSDAYQATGEHAHSGKLMQDGFHAALASFPAAVRESRLGMARDLMLGAIGDRRARIASGLPLPLPDDDLFVQDLFDAMVGLLCADHTAVRTRRVTHATGGR